VVRALVESGQAFLAEPQDSRAALDLEVVVEAIGRQVEMVGLAGAEAEPVRWLLQAVVDFGAGRGMRGTLVRHGLVKEVEARGLGAQFSYRLAQFKW